MYPKVKVRELDSESDDDTSFGWSGMSSPDEYQADSPKCIIRVPTAQYSIHELSQPSQEPKVNEKEKKSEEPDRLSARSSSVLRPRAVLSSPDNDEMIGGKNRKRVIQPSQLTNHNTVQNRHAQCKIIPIQTTTERPVSTRRKPAGAVTDQTPYTTRNLNSTKGKPKAAKDQTPSKMKQSGIIASSQKANLKTFKPKTTGSQREKPNSTGSQLGRMSQN